MYNIFDLILVLYEKWVETALIKFNVFELVTKFYMMANIKILLLCPEFTFTVNMVNATITALKFLILIAMLVFIRGGIPRYRYDFLTKIGWIKFLSLILAVFLSTLLFNYLM